MSEILELTNYVNQMKIKDDFNEKNKIIIKIQKEKNLTNKCVLARMYLPSQSNIMEKIIKNDLHIKNTLNEISGDGNKNNINYEIKYSGHAKKSKFNFVQIRPDHKIDYYIFCGYNMYDTSSIIGKAYIFKVPSKKVYEWIIKYGGYAHGTIKKLGIIDDKNIVGRNCEYALRVSPINKKGKNLEFWNELIKYEVEYLADNF